VVDSGNYDPTLENPKIHFRGVEFALDPMLKEGESANDYAALLVGHTFEIGMAPDRFTSVGGNGSAQIVGGTVGSTPAEAAAYASSFPAGGLTLEFVEGA